MAYRPTARTETHKARQHEALVNAAHQLVSNGGFSALTVQAVAESAGIATGSVYRHFLSKAELCAEVFRRATQREVDRVAEIVQQQGAADIRLQRLIDAFCQRAIRGRVQAYALIAEPVDPLVETERLRYREAYTQLFRQLIEDGMRESVFPAQNATVSAAAMVGALAETLVGPLAMHLQRNTDFNAEEETQLITSIRQFCMRAITGKEPQP